MHKPVGILIIVVWFAGQATSVMVQPENQVLAETRRRLSGVVLDASSRAPLSGASVSVRRVGNGADERLQTDAAGRFATMLPPGPYRITATAASYLRGGFGQSVPDDLGQTLVVSQADSNVEVVLWRAATLEGVVRDADRNPIAEASVKALKKSIVGGELRYVTTASIPGTDAGGRYRLSNLSAGDYLLAVSASAVRIPQPGAQARVIPYATVFYPASETTTQAHVVSLTGGQHAGGVDFEIRLADRDLGSITGAIGGVSPCPPSLVVELRRANTGTPTDLTARQIKCEPSGRFTFEGVSKGKYELRAVLFPAGAPPEATGEALPPLGSTQTLWASQVVDVVDDAASGSTTKVVDPVLLPLRSAPVVAGQFVFEGASEKPTLDALARSAVVAESMEGLLPPLGPVQADATFTLPGLPDGRYSFRAIRLWPGWYLRSVTLGGREILGSTVDVGATDATTLKTLQFIFTDRRISVTGYVNDEKGLRFPGATVCVFPKDERLWSGYGHGENRIFQLRPDSAGFYEVYNLVPGSYYFAAVLGSEARLWADPAVLGRLVSSAVEIKVGHGESLTRDLIARSP